MAISNNAWKVLVAFSALGLALPATAQQADAALYRELARALRKELPKGQILLEPYYLAATRATGAIERPLAAAVRVVLQESLEADTARMRDVASCPGRLPENCRLSRGVAVVRIGEPRVTGDTARVDVYYAVQTGSPRTPVGQSEVLFVLVHRAGIGWQVVERILVSMT